MDAVVRITFVKPYPTLSGGTKAVALLAQGLIRLGHDVMVSSEPFAPPSWRIRMRKYKHALMAGHRFPRFGPEPNHIDLAGLPHKVRPVPGPVRDQDLPDADVVIATWWETALPVCQLSASKGAKVYFMQDYGAPGMELEHLVPTWRLPMHMVTIAQWLVDLVIEHAGPRQLDLMPDGVETEVFFADPRTKQRAPTIGFLYREEHVKGYDLVRDAFTRARRVVPELLLLTFGPNEPRELPLPVGMEFRFRPDEAELRKIYAGCDAWVFASRSEGFGLPILEAMACRTPVIATPAGAAPEIIAQGGGMMARAEDVEHLAERMVEIARMPEAEWQDLSEAASIVAKKYTWDDACQLFEASLYKAVEKSKQSGLTR